MALSQCKRLSGCFRSLSCTASPHLAVRSMRSLTEAHISSVQRLPRQQRMQIGRDHLHDLAQPTRASRPYSKFLRHQLSRKFVPAPDQGQSETCYAHAIASATHSALLRVVRRDGGYPDFEDIRDDIIHKFEDRVSRSDHAVKHIKRQLCSGDGFANESQEAEEVTSISDDDDIVDDNVVDVGGAGHSVTYVRDDDNYMTLMNSWGPDWVQEVVEFQRHTGHDFAMIPRKVCVKEQRTRGLWGCRTCCQTYAHLATLRFAAANGHLEPCQGRADRPQHLRSKGFRRAWKVKINRPAINAVLHLTKEDKALLNKRGNKLQQELGVPRPRKAVRQMFLKASKEKQSGLRRDKATSSSQAVAPCKAGPSSERTKHPYCTDVPMTFNEQTELWTWKCSRCDVEFQGEEARKLEDQGRRHVKKHHAKVVSSPIFKFKGKLCWPCTVCKCKVYADNKARLKDKRRGHIISFHSDCNISRLARIEPNPGPSICGGESHDEFRLEYVNVNGYINAAVAIANLRKQSTKPHIFCMAEVKANNTQRNSLTGQMRRLGYRSFWVHEPDGTRTRKNQAIAAGGVMVAVVDTMACAVLDKWQHTQGEMIHLDLGSSFLTVAWRRPGGERDQYDAEANTLKLYAASKASTWLIVGDQNDLPGTPCWSADLHLMAPKDDDDNFIASRWEGKRCVDWAAGNWRTDWNASYGLDKSSCRAHGLVDEAPPTKWSTTNGLSYARGPRTRCDVPTIVLLRRSGGLTLAKMPRSFSNWAISWEGSWRLDVNKASGASNRGCDAGSGQMEKGWPAEVAASNGKVRQRGHHVASWSLVPSATRHREGERGSKPGRYHYYRKSEFPHDFWREVWDRDTVQTLPYDIDAVDTFEWSSGAGPLKAAELQRTAKTMKGGPAGPDGWSAAELSSLPFVFWEQLERRLEEWHLRAQYPKAWTHARMVCIPKDHLEPDADHVQVDRMRPISVLSAVYRVVISTWMSRREMRAWLDHIMPEDFQGGLQGRCAETGVRRLDAAYHLLPLAVLQGLGAPTRMLGILQHTWLGQERWLQLGGVTLAEGQWAGTSLPQGCPAAPMGLTALLRRPAMALHRLLGDRLTQVIYLDDRNLVVRTAQDAQDPGQQQALRRLGIDVHSEAKVLGATFFSHFETAPEVSERAEHTDKMTGRLRALPVGQAGRELMYCTRVAPAASWGFWSEQHCAAADTAARRAVNITSSAARALWQVLAGHPYDMRFFFRQSTILSFLRAEWFWRRRGIQLPTGLWTQQVNADFRALGFEKTGPWRWHHPEAGDVKWFEGSAWSLIGSMRRGAARTGSKDVFIIEVTLGRGDWAGLEARIWLRTRATARAMSSWTSMTGSATTWSKTSSGAQIWGDRGFFKIAGPWVLDEEGPMQFFEIFWFQGDRSEQEQASYRSLHTGRLEYPRSSKVRARKSGRSG
ncbi:unnamed protein product [Symbiodinium sp. CCMP2592]|nr:unnamed protein product [Symbiodinium sp. CCMP2592]